MVESAALVAWLYLACFHGRFWRIRPLLKTVPLPDDARTRRVAVVMPARDEAATIAQAVGSLKAQRWRGPLQIIVVDDSSSDDTAAIARHHGATVISAGALPSGWTGKMWALSKGVEAALPSAPDFLLFTDADIVHDSDSIERWVAIAEAESRDLVSIMVKLRCESFAERLLIPAFVFFFFMLYPPKWIANHRRRTAGAAGGCILIRPAALERTGGIAAIRAELIDDCALAAAVKRTGGSLWLGLSEETRSIRPYSGFSDVGQMISRTAFTQLRYSTLLLLGTVLGLMFLYLSPVVGVWQGRTLGIASWAIMALVYCPMLRLYRVPAAYSICLPLIAAFYMVSTVSSAINYWSGRGGAWKNRNQAYDAPPGAS